MAWLRLTLELAAPQVEAVTDFLEQFDAACVSYRPASTEPLFAGVGADPVLWQRTLVTALIDAETDIDILLACLRNRIGDANIHACDIEPLQDRNWIESYRENVSALVLGRRLCICPSWLEPVPGCEHNVILDPGLAFGSGTHATTRMCLDWLVCADLSDRTVIDYGCGSGILALAAARLGARHVYALDIDPQALQATRKNIEINRLEKQISVLEAGAAAVPRVDILIANILLQPLLQLAGLFEQLITERGCIVLSGILSTQAQQCLETYGRWFKMEPPGFLEEWALLHGHR